jgi:hypothetical protein
LVDAIERLQKNKEYQDVPGLFWDILVQGSAKKLGDQYENQIHETIIEGYIPIPEENDKSKDVQEDVYLKFEDLDDWRDILRGIVYSSTSEPGQLRSKFITGLQRSLEKVVNKPLYDHVGGPLEDYLIRQGGLPVRDTSPLFSYSINELKDPVTVPDCELGRLLVWIHNVSQMLSIVANGTMRPVFNEKPFTGSCPKGENIPFIEGDIDQEDLVRGSIHHRYDHAFHKARIYWVPKEYLP